MIHEKKIELKEQLYQKQRKYAELMKLKAGSKVLEDLSREIGSINSKLYSHVSGR